MQTAFKVTVNENSWSGNFPLKYRLGETTVPTIGKIFVFKNAMNAKRFIDFYRYSLTDDIIIFEGTCKNLRHIPYVSQRGNIELFWLRRKQHKKYLINETKMAPIGSFVTDTFTPTKKYTYKQFVQNFKLD